MPKSPPVNLRLEAETYNKLKKQADSSGTPLAKVVASVVENAMQENHTLDRIKMQLIAIEDNQNDLRNDIATACATLIGTRPDFGHGEEKDQQRALEIINFLAEKLSGSRRVSFKYEEQGL